EAHVCVEVCVGLPRCARSGPPYETCGLLPRRSTVDRRDFFSWSARGLGATAALHLLLRDGALAAGTHHPARAKRAVQISLVGGLSHVDSFDFKPLLARHHGKALQTDTKPDVFFNQVGLLRKNDWDFK